MKIHLGLRRFAEKRFSLSWRLANWFWSPGPIGGGWPKRGMPGEQLGSAMVIPNAPPSDRISSGPGEVPPITSNPVLNPLLNAEGSLDDELVRDVFGPSQTTESSAAESSTAAEEDDPSTADGPVPDGKPQVSTDDQLETEAAGEASGEQTSSIHTVQDAAAVSGPDLDDRGPDPITPRMDPPRHGSSVRDRHVWPNRQRQVAEVAPEPLVKTMVESLPKSGGGDVGLDLLPEGLDDIFQQKEYHDPRVKSLLMELEKLDINELTRELTDFAKGIGATSNRE